MKTTIVGLLLLLMFAACSSSPKKNEGEQPSAKAVPQQAAPDAGSILHLDKSMLRDLRITTGRVEERAGAETATLQGELRLNENSYAEVGAPIPSRVIAVSVTAGQTVHSGQVLAILQSPDVGKARSEVLSGEARLELAKRALERKRRLGKERIVSEREIQEAEANAASAEAGLRAAQAALGALGVKVADSDAVGDDSARFALHSPLTGTVIERSAVNGQLADPAQPLFRIGDLSRIWLTVHAFERDAVRIKAGTQAGVSFTALPGQTFIGRVTLVGKQVESDSRTVPVRIEIANQRGDLRPGMSATASVVVGNVPGKVLAIPVAAMQRLADRWVVFIPQGEDSFEMRPVGRGRDLGGEVEILSGLKAGETVVVDGAFLLKAQAERARGEGEHDHD
jgi:cobalt-zinc-cadmium efflux system membrane fusion protein